VFLRAFYRIVNAFVAKKRFLEGDVQGKKHFYTTNWRTVKAQEAHEAQGEAQEAQEAQGEAQDPHFNLTPLEIAILEACQDDPRTSQELLAVAGYSSRTGNFKRSIDRLLTYRLIQMTTPDKPRSSRQKYRLTEKGKHLLVRRKENCLGNPVQVHVPHSS